MLDLDYLRKSVEKERNKTLKAGVGLIVLNVFLILILGYILRSGNVSFFFFIVLSIIVSIPLSIRAFKYVKHGYVLRVKKIVFEDVFMKLFEDGQYDTAGGIDYWILNNSGVLNGSDINEGNDYLAGTYNDVRFERSDIITKEHSVSDEGRESYFTLFKGQVYGFDFNKKNSSMLRIVDKSIVDSVNVFSNESIKLENAEFNRKFMVESPDEHDAFYVLTPHFMERYLKLNKELDGKTTMSIADGKLCLSVYNKRDSFEPSVLTLGNKFKKTIEQDINIIKTIIDDLDLKNTLFKSDI